MIYKLSAKIPQYRSVDTLAERERVDASFLSLKLLAREEFLVSMRNTRVEIKLANSRIGFEGRIARERPLFTLAVSLTKYLEARGHIDVACGPLIITYRARKGRAMRAMPEHAHAPWPTSKGKGRCALSRELSLLSNIYARRLTNNSK